MFALHYFLSFYIKYFKERKDNYVLKIHEYIILFTKELKYVKMFFFCIWKRIFVIFLFNVRILLLKEIIIIIKGRIFLLKKFIHECCQIKLKFCYKQVLILIVSAISMFHYLCCHSILIINLNRLHLMPLSHEHNVKQNVQQIRM